MGAIDFLKECEGRVLDAASFQKLKRNYELQEENNSQLKNKVEHLQNENAILQEKIDKAFEENKELQEKLDVFATEDLFVTRGEFAFKRGQDGKFESTPYCPECKSVMGTLSRRKYKCSKCEYIVVKCEVIPRTLIDELNAKSE